MKERFHKRKSDPVAELIMAENCQNKQKHKIS